MDLTVVPGRRAACDVQGELRLYDLNAPGEYRVLLDYDPARHRLGHPTATADGRRVIVTRAPAIPADWDGDRGDRNAYQRAMMDIHGGMPTDYLDLDLDTGDVRVVFHDPKHGNNHAQPSPSDPDLWLIDRDPPPGFGRGGDLGVSTRAWLLRSSIGELTQLRPDNPHRFQIHCNWSGDGRHIYYHGRSLPPDIPPDGRDTREKIHKVFDGQYVGVFDIQGGVEWETWVPNYHYGHVATDPTRDVIIADGLYTFDHVTAIAWRDHAADGVPRVELLAKHATKWSAAPGQYSHPHPHVSSDGRWLSYNRAYEDGRTDVYLVRLK